MLDDQGIEFCEVCGLTFIDGKCPNCDIDRPKSKEGQAALQRRSDHQAILEGRPKWQRVILRGWWLITV